MATPTPRKTKSGKWNIQIQLGGNRVSITKPTKTECIEHAKLLRKRYEIGAYTPEKKGGITWAEAIRAYMDANANVLSPSTLRTYDIFVRNHMKNVMKTGINEAINWQMVINAEAKKYAPKTVKNDWGMITAVMNHNGLTVPRVNLPQIVKKEKLFLDVDQIKTLLSAVRGTPLEMPVLLGLHGLRRSEMLAVHRMDIDTKKAEIRVSGAVVKGIDGFVEKETNKNETSARTVPVMIPRLLEIAKKARDPLIEYAPESIGRAINLVCLRNGLPEIGVHGLRHSFITLCWSAGVSPVSAQRFGGYSNLQTMLDIYTHLSEKDAKKDADKIRAVFANMA